MVVFDATDMILGRLASTAARRAILGENVEVINCEKAVITGARKRTLADYKQRFQRGSPTTGPFFRRMPDRFVKRAIRGMIPYKREKGTNALKRVMCYMGVPDHLKDVKAETLPQANISKITVVKYTTVEEICRNMGGKI